MSVTGLYSRPNTPVGPGYYGRAVVRLLAYLPKPVRGRRFRPLRVGHVVRFVVTSAASAGLPDHGRCRPTIPKTALLKRRGTLKAKRFFGPLTRPRPTRRFISAFSTLV
jgi:hypothetical protein